MSDYLTVYYTIIVTIIVITVFSVNNVRIRNFIIISVSVAFLTNLSYKSTILILSNSVIFFAIGLFLSKYSKRKRNNVILLISIVYIVLVLFLFKYFNGFINYNIDTIGNKMISSVFIFVPIGISYYSFQLLSYVIEIHRGRIQAERNYFIFLEYIVYFPKLTAGPIERPYDLIPQFKKVPSISYEEIKYGMILIAFGIFKKFVLAENISIAINPIFDDLKSNSGFIVLISSFLYSFQIYFDFSGYTDIALGISCLLGIKLSDNFNKPYLSASLSEFWRRWHISLSLWIRDYIFLPIAYYTVKRKFWAIIKIKSEKITYIIATLISMVIFGLWHGFKVTFVIWGIYNALLLSVPVLMRKGMRIKKNNRNIMIKRFIVFILITIGWIIFRANNIEEAFSVYLKVIDLRIITDYLVLSKMNLLNILLIITGIASIMLLDILSKKKNSISYLMEQRKSIKWVTYFVLMLCIAFLGSFGNSSFIYFNF